MLKGKDLVDKLIELDGLSPVELMSQCGCEDNGSYLLPEKFYPAISKFAVTYVEAVSNLRKKQLLDSKRDSCSTDLLLQRLVGSELLKRVYDLDSSFNPGPPWDEKRKIVIKCGYVGLTSQAEIKVDYSDFNAKFIEARSTDIERDLENFLADSELNPLKYDDSLIRVVAADSQDEIDHAARRLIDVAESIRVAWTGPELKAVRIEYSGCGDDGEVVSLEYLLSGFKFGHEPDKPEQDRTDPPDAIIFNGEPLNRDEYERQIKDDAFSISYNCHGSWFNECGGDGFLLIDIASSTIYGHHFQNDDPNGFPGLRASFLSPYFIAVRDV